MGQRIRFDTRRLTPRRALALLIVAAVAYGSSHLSCRNDGAGPLTQTALGQAHDQRRSNVLVQGGGRVKYVLRDDTRGARHQHLIVEVPEGFTVKLAHNIDLAPRVPAGVGEHLDFRGIYEFNDKGGVVHWTHHDPAGKHPGGWIKHRGRVYE